MNDIKKYECTWCKGLGTISKKEDGHFTSIWFSLDSIFTLLPLVGIAILTLALYFAGILQLDLNTAGIWKLIGFFGLVLGIFVFCLRNIWRKLSPLQLECPRCKGRGVVE